MDLHIDPKLDGTVVTGWDISTSDLPTLKGASPGVVRYASDIRISALNAFARAALEHGGPEALATRHWWTPELESEIAHLRRLLIERLEPLVERCLDSQEWINEVPRGTRLHNPNIVGQMLARHLPTTE